MTAYENQRVHFDRLLAKYKEYLNIYREFNGGSLVGATTLGEFYMRMTYYSKYHDRRNFGHNSF